MGTIRQTFCTALTVKKLKLWSVGLCGIFLHNCTVNHQSSSFVEDWIVYFKK